MLRAGRIPGAAVAVVVDDETVFAKGYGCRDLDGKSQVTADTLYPIASTSKAMNATLLAMLAEEGRLQWDEPVQQYLPYFRLHDPTVSASVTLRDLVVMRTGLPRHDFVWLENPITRAELVACVGHLPLSCGFRERFQYNNLTPSLAGYVAEVVTGETWERLIRSRLLEPLGMRATCFGVPDAEESIVGYHENRRRNLIETRRLATEPIAPAGGAIYSTVNEMSRWVACNLSGKTVAGSRPFEPRTLAQLHSPEMLMGADAASPSPHAAYGLGWFVDTYNGHRRISHTGWLHDVHSCVTLFPDRKTGIVSFVNFASSRPCTVLNQQIFQFIEGLASGGNFADVLGAYEQKLRTTLARMASVPHVSGSVPSHALQEYVGVYAHPGYGRLEILLDEGTLYLRRNRLDLPLQHWHFDSWVVADNDLFEIHKPHPLERANRFVFETDADGEITAFSSQLEPAAARARFEKQ
jgi:CubicO group peptidase (beta-lactamase class C family)